MKNVLIKTGTVMGLLMGTVAVACPAKICNDTKYTLDIVDHSSMKLNNNLCPRGTFTLGSGDTHPNFSFTLRQPTVPCSGNCLADNPVVTFDADVMNYEYHVKQVSCTGGAVDFQASQFIKAADQSQGQQTALPDRAQGHYVVTKKRIN